MTDRERLIELFEKMDKNPEITCPCPDDVDSCKNCQYAIGENGWLCDLNARRVDHLLANGVIVPPCMVGDIVYPLNADRRFRAIIEKIEINANGLLFYWVQYDVGVDCTECWDEDLFTVDDIGKTVFLDETEYLIALKERDGK